MPVKKRAVAATAPTRSSTRNTATAGTASSRSTRAAKSKPEQSEEPKSTRTKRSAPADEAADASEPAPKRLRGRPAKEQKDTTVEAPPKRGRPPKNQNRIEVEDEKEDDDEIAQEAPRKRGRPPTKTKVVPEEAKSEEEAAPKKRGRPSKKPSKVQVKVESKPKSASKKRGRPAKELDDAEEDASPPAKKQRGRPPKADPSRTPALPKPRGRPPKEEPKSEPAPPKERPGRPRRAAPKAAQVPNTDAGHQKPVRGQRTKAAHAPEQLPLGEQANQAMANEQLLGEADSTPAGKRQGRSRSKLLQDMDIDVQPAARGVKRGRPKTNKMTEKMIAEVEEDEIEERARAKRAKVTSDEDTPKSAASGAKRGRKRGPAAKAKEDPKPKTANESARGKSTKAGTTAATAASKLTKGGGKSIAAEVTDAAQSAIGEVQDMQYIDEHGRQLWVMKAEPESRMEKGKDVKFSIDDLAACVEPEPWTGVRNAVAKNNMVAMRVGDLAFFYHSNCKTPGIAGVMKVVKEATPDESAFDPADPYYDEKSDRAKPKWFNVHVEYIQKVPNYVTLTELKTHIDGDLSGMQLLKQSRLSVSKVTQKEWNFVMKMAGADAIPAETSKTNTTVQQSIADAIEDAPAVAGEVLSEVTAAAADAVSSAVKNIRHLFHPSEGSGENNKAASGRKDRAASVAPTTLQTPVVTSKRASSAQPSALLVSVDEDAVVGAVPPAFALRSSPPIATSQDAMNGDENTNADGVTNGGGVVNGNEAMNGDDAANEDFIIAENGGVASSAMNEEMEDFLEDSL